MNLLEVSEMTGISSELLRKMRARETITLNSGPPFCKVMTTFGNTAYVYKRTEVKRWLNRRRFRVTAGDAAQILGISRAELLGAYNQGQHSWDTPRGKLVIQVSKNIYIWVPRLSAAT